MKIAVYTIALNEEKFVQQWYDSAKDADYLLIADTGSTDKTKRLAKKLGIKVVDISIKPWRFDDARNAALAVLPDDIDLCVSLDMDEVLSPGWRENLEKTTGTQIAYKYTWSWRDPITHTKPKVVYVASKIHARHGYRWKNMVHEIPMIDRIENHVPEFCEGLEIWHYADIEKERSSYDKLIEDCINEDPNNDRYQMYYYKMLCNMEDKQKAIKETKKFIKMKPYQTGASERSRAYQELARLDPKKTIFNLLMSHYTYKRRREPLVDLATYFFYREKWNLCIFFINKALKITVREADPEYLEYAWSYLPTNMLAVAKHNRKLFKWSKNYEELKWKMNPHSLISSSFELFKDEGMV